MASSVSPTRRAEVASDGRIRRQSYRKPLMHPSSYNPSFNAENDIAASSSVDDFGLKCEMCGELVLKGHHHRHPPHVPTEESLAWEDYNNVSATFNRHKYYSRLVDPQDDRMRIPDHILPSSLFYLIPTKPEDRQSSIVTIFAIWNTMIGSSLLSIPWGISQAGFSTGVILIVFLGLLTLYTAYIIVRSKEYLDVPVCEFTDVTRYYFGRGGEYFSFIFGIIALVGGMLVYWVLMTNFLYMTGVFIHDKATHAQRNNTNYSNDAFPDTVCHIVNDDNNTSSSQHLLTNSIIGWKVSANHSGEPDAFERFWSIDRSAPLCLIILIFPLLNIKSPTFFTKFNCLGTLSVIYLWSLVITKAVKWGVHLDFTGAEGGDVVPQFSNTFPALTGMLSLAYFLHNAVMTILSNNKHPQNNVRDLSIGYLLVMFTYLFVGILFFVTFPLAKKCIAPVLFDNLTTWDVQAVIGRTFLLFQMWTVFPLLAYMTRVQIMYFVFGRVWPSIWHVIALNICFVTLCVLVAMFYPHIGDIIRYSGSLCGLVYVFLLPSVVFMRSHYLRNGFHPLIMIIHFLIIAIGVANFVAQFVIHPSK